MKLRNLVFLTVILGTLVLLGCSEKSSTDYIAVVASIEKGTVMLKRASATEFVKIEVKAGLSKGDTIRTGPDTHVILRFGSGTLSRVMSDTDLEIKDQKAVSVDQSLVYTHLIKGIAYFYVPKGSSAAKKLEIETDRAIASIKGTNLKLETDQNKTQLTVGEGVVAFMAKATGESIDVPTFSMATISDEGMKGPDKINTLQDEYLADAPVKYFETEGK